MTRSIRMPGADGFVAYPDINPLTEMVDLMGATRSYGMNASAITAEKGMISSSLDLLKVRRCGKT